MMQDPGLVDRCARAAKRARFDEMTLSTRLAQLDYTGRQRALTDTESRELERLMVIKDRRDDRRALQGRKPVNTPARTTFAGVPVAAMEATMAERQRQIAQFGHTPEADREAWHAGKPDRLARVAVNYALEARESMSFGRQQLHVARLKSIKAAAALLAQIDLIDALLAEDPEA